MTKIYNRRKSKGLRRALKRNSTKSEDRLWNGIRNKKLGYKFRRQQGVLNYIVDFYCPELRLVIEVDGITHDDLDVIRRDKIRQKALEGFGLRVLCYSACEVFENLEGVLLDIKGVCDKISGEVRVDWGEAVD